MVSMFLHRRDVLSYYEEPAPTAPLYPFPTIEDGTLAGTGGQRVVYNNTQARYTGVYHNKVGLSTTVLSGAEVFTIPTGASYVLTAEINTLVSSAGLKNAGFYLKNTSSINSIKLTAQDGDDIAEPGLYTVTGVAAYDINVGEFGFQTARVSGVCKVDMTITLTVNGVRYI